MPTPTIYTLPLGYRAKFPSRCICCDEIPDSTIKIAQNSNNPFLSFLFPIIDFFNWSRVEIPICHRCKFRFRLQRYTRELLLIVCVVAAIFFVMPYFAGWTGFGKKVAVAIVVLLLVIPYFLYEFIFPRYFDTTAWGKTVNYEFVSKDYAYEFYDLNADNIIS